MVFPIFNPDGTTVINALFNGANKLVKLDSGGKLPAVDGSQLTNIPVSGGLTPVAIAFGDSPYSASNGELIIADTSGGAITVNLPASGSDGQIVVKGNFATNNLTIDAAGSDTINGSGTKILSNDGHEESLAIVSSQTDWNSTTLAPSSATGTTATYQLNFSTTTSAADPGDYSFRADNATPASITNLYLDDLVVAGIDLGVLYSKIRAGTIIRFVQGDDNSKGCLVETTGVATDNTGWWTVPITHSDGNILPDDGAACNIDIEIPAVDVFDSSVFAIEDAGNQLAFDLSAFTTNRTITFRDMAGTVATTGNTDIVGLTEDTTPDLASFVRVNDGVTEEKVALSNLPASQLNPAGEYNAGTSYDKHDYIYDPTTTKNWVSTVGSNLGNTPGTDPEWMQLTFGEDGEDAVLNPAILPHISTPSDPGAGNTAIYAKSDGNVYKFPTGGSEEEIGAGGGGTGNPNRVVALLNFEEVNDSARFVNESPLLIPFSQTSNAKISSTQSKWGSTSLFCNRGTDSISTAVSDPLFSLFGDDWTFHLWVYPTLDFANQGLFGVRSGHPTFYMCLITLDNEIRFFNTNSGTTTTDVITNGTLSKDVWTHILVERYQGTINIYIGGVKETLTGPNGSVDYHFNPTDVFRLGMYIATSPDSGLQGYIDGFVFCRATSPQARGAASFTVPAQAPTSSNCLTFP